MFLLAEKPFASLQGEGIFTGRPTIFIRFFGCNMRCPGFGRPRNDNKTPNLEVMEVINHMQEFPDKYKTIDDFPLVHTGCDSYTSSYPQFAKYALEYDVEKLVEEIKGMLPHGSWKGYHLAITGGEPMLHQKSIVEILSNRFMQDCEYITFETNGTLDLKADLATMLYMWVEEYGHESVNFSVSPKLSCSGNDLTQSIRPNAVASYEGIGMINFKFVVGDEEDMVEVERALDVYATVMDGFEVYLMPVGGTIEGYQMSKVQVAELAMKYGYNFSDRLHITLWGNKWGA